MRLVHVLLPGLALISLLGCEEQPAAETAPAASSRPAVEVVVRSVEIKKHMTTPPAGGQGEDESWSAIDGKVYAIVTVDMAHNACNAGDKIETSKAVLEAAEGKVAPVGGGARLERLCIQCQPTEALDCNTAAQLRPFTFVFEVDEKADVTQAKLTYKDRTAPLSGARISDSRANDELTDQIEAKRAEIADLKKKLENTSNMANGQVIQSEMARIQKEIEALEKKKK